MTAETHRTFSLIEHESTLVPRQEITHEEGKELWRRLKDHVDVNFPSPVTQDNWRLSARGSVGYLPVSDGFAVEIKPKVGVRNLFRLLEYAYRLESFHFLDGLFLTDTLQDVYERLAGELARRVLDRTRRGLYRAYLGRSEYLPYVKGRLEVRKLSLKPWVVNLPCTYEDHTTDIEDNRILSWSLSVIVRSGFLTGRELPNVRRAYRAQTGAVEIYPVGPESCLGRHYNRLNEDYKPMHALCRFFLENSGPTHERGDRSMLPFIVNMSRLYERFVSEWMKAHLPPGVSLMPQEQVDIDANTGLHFDIDLVLRDAVTDEVLCVLDTKYKDAIAPTTDDVAQIVAYAEAMECREAILVYPRGLPRPLEARVGDIRVRSLSFSLDGDLDEAGHGFIRTVLGDTPVRAGA